MKYRGKAIQHDIWVHGSFTTEKNGVQGGYIDIGGFPGANIYAVKRGTVSELTGKQDKRNNEIYGFDFLLWEYETENMQEFTYLKVTGRNELVDITTGEIMTFEGIPSKEITVIGNSVDYPNFENEILIDSLEHLPYIPKIDVINSPYPFYVLTCRSCGNRTLGMRFRRDCPNCGGVTDCIMPGISEKESPDERQLTRT